jgi:hypothetical protein
MQKPDERHNSEYIYKVPYIEHEYKMFKASRILRRIVTALIVTNACWLFALIMSLKK